MSTNDYERGVQLFDLGRYELAEEALRSHLSRAPDDFSALGLLAFCRMNQGDLGGALAAAKQAAAAGSDDPYPFYVLALVHDRRQEFDPAAKAIDEAIRFNANNADYFSIASRIAQGQARWARSLRFAELGLECDPRHADCMDQQLNAFWELRRRDDFNRALDAAIVANPENPNLYCHQARRLFDQGDKMGAENSYLEALRIDPTYSFARYELKQKISTGSWPYRVLLSIGRTLSNNSGFHFANSLTAAVIGGIVTAIAVPGMRKGWNEFWVFVAIGALIVGLLLDNFRWTANSLFDSLLYLHPRGRLALSEESFKACRRRWIEAGILAGVVSCYTAARLTGLLKF